jgi:hypothetical protein
MEPIHSLAAAHAYTFLDCFTALGPSQGLSPTMWNPSNGGYVHHTVYSQGWQA